MPYRKKEGSSLETPANRYEVSYAAWLKWNGAIKPLGGQKAKQRPRIPRLTPKTATDQECFSKSRATPELCTSNA